MQVARNFFLTPEKTYTRKLSEILLALRIEQELSKQEILELYLNKIYLGHRAYGVGAAAQIYYGAALSELDLAQIAMVAGLPKAPSRFNPVTNPSRALERRNYVLDRMQTLGHIDVEEYRAARARPVTATVHAARIEIEAPYVAEMVRAEIVERYGEEAYARGFRVETTIDQKLQSAANDALRKALDDYDRRHGWRGPEGHIENPPQDSLGLDPLLAEWPRVGGLLPAIVTAVKDRSIEVYLGQGQRVEIDWEGLRWARAYIDENEQGPKPKTATEIVRVGDVCRVQQIDTAPQSTEEPPTLRWRLAQVPAVSGAFVALDPHDGAIRALVGGYDFFASKFNRAVQAKRQPGSGFKAFVYSAALEAGFTAASLINDAPVIYHDVQEDELWRPKNYSGRFYGPTRLRYALTKSRNLVSIRLMRDMGVEHAVRHIARFGFDREQLPHNLSLSLGSSEVTPLQMARGYAVLANGGYLIDPYFIRRITDGEDREMFRAEPNLVCEDCPVEANAITEISGDGQGLTMEAKDRSSAHAPRVISAQNRYLMYSMLQDVIQRGTASKARVLKRNDLAGKTGTTNDQRDAWFNGFNQSLVAIAWVGFDDYAELGRGEVGGKAALPAWIDFMRVALAEVPEELPSVPRDMVTVRIDPQSGLRASAGQEDAILEVFRADNVPAWADAGPNISPVGGSTRGTTASSTSTAVDELF
jgi:penicillin-binding protein 1A